MCMPPCGFCRGSRHGGRHDAPCRLVLVSWTAERRGGGSPHAARRQALSRFVCLNLPPGSRKVLPPSSPLRTGRESCPSSGSSPWPLSPVLLVTLPMAPGVYKAFVAKVVSSALAFEDNMVRFYGFSWYKLDMTQSAAHIPASGAASAVVSRRFPVLLVASCALSSSP